VKPIDLLRQLQEVDSRLDADRARLVEVVAELADRSAVDDARRERDERAVTLKQIEAEQRDLELEIETFRAQLTAIENKLYGGRVGDAKELTNLNREAGQVRGLISPREDRLLQLFEAADEASATLAAAEARLGEVEAARRMDEARLGAERDTLSGAIGVDETTQASVRPKVAPATLRTYDHLRRTRGGLAVAEVRQRTCQGCRISLTISEEQRARHGDTLVICQSCGRILYATS